MFRRRISCAFPFHQYAIEGVLHHDNEAADSKSQEAFGAQFPISQWVFANNINQIYDNHRYRINETLLYIFARENYLRLICMLRFGRPDAFEGRDRSPLFAAFQSGRQVALKTLLGGQALPFLEEIPNDSGFGRRVQLRSREDLSEWAERTGNTLFLACPLIPQRALDLPRFGLSNDKLDRVFQAASVHGHEKVVRFLLDEEIYTPSRLLSGTPLCVASYAGHDKIEQLLLDPGAYAATQVEKYLALLIASRGDIQIAQMMIHAGADFNARNSPNVSPLHAALHRGLMSAVNALLHAGVNIREQDLPILSLTTAVTGGHARLVEMLLHAGADANAEDTLYDNALQAAPSHGNEEIVAMLLRAGAHVNARTDQYGTALQAASCTGWTGVVEVLLDAGANVDAQGGYCGNSLLAAVENRHATTVKMLLDAGADANAHSKEFSKALQAACWAGKADIAEMLLQARASVNGQGGCYGSALWIAASWYPEELKLVGIPRNPGADVNARGAHHSSVLQIASKKRGQKVVQLLLNTGVKPEDNAQLAGSR